MFNGSTWKSWKYYILLLTVCVCVCVCVYTLSCIQPHRLQPARLLCPQNSPGKVSCHSYSRGSSPPREPQSPASPALGGFFTISATLLLFAQALSHAQLFRPPRTAACQAYLPITNTWTLLKLMSIESVMPSNYLILCHPFSSCLQSCPASESFPMGQIFTSGSQSIGALTSASVLPLNIQD